jgi:outer membrane protein
LARALALALTLPAVPALAADTRIGVIDSQRIFAEFQEARDAESAFQLEMKKWQDDLLAQEKEISTLQDKIRSQALLLSKEKLDELQADLDKKYQAYESAKNDLFDPTKGKAVARNKELSQPINDKITTVVERLGAEQNFTIIVDMASINVVYMDKAIDLTDKVLEELAKAGK